MFDKMVKTTNQTQSVHVWALNSRPIPMQRDWKLFLFAHLSIYRWIHHKPHLECYILYYDIYIYIYTQYVIYIYIYNYNNNNTNNTNNNINNNKYIHVYTYYSINQLTVLMTPLVFRAFFFYTSTFLTTSRNSFGFKVKLGQVTFSLEKVSLGSNSIPVINFDGAQHV